MTARLTPKRIRDQQDFNATPGSGNDGYAVVYDHGSGKFALSRMQPHDAELAAIAGLTSAADRLPYYTGSGTAALATFTSFGRSLVDDADAATARTTLGLGTIATATETNYLLADGSRAGATSSRQVFTQGITTGSIRPASNSTTALQFQESGGLPVVTIDMTNRGVIINKWLRNSAGAISQYIASGTVNQFLFSSNGYFDSSEVAWYALDASLPGWRLDMASHVASNSDIVTIHHRNAGAAANAWSQYLAVFGSGDMALGAHVATALLDLAASTTTRASLRIRAGTAPTTPNDGDVWYDGAHFYGRAAGVTKQLDN